jgi:RHS repeat-associated protein
LARASTPARIRSIRSEHGTSARISEVLRIHRQIVLAIAEAAEDFRLDRIADRLYDVFDRLVGKTIKNGSGVVQSREAYVYDGDNMVLEFQNASGAALTNADLVRRFLNGAAVDQVFAEEVTSGSSSNQTLWLLADNEGTIRDVATYAAGVTTIQDHLVYDSFGNVTYEKNSAYAPTFTYTGQMYDADAQLYYYRARWYDPATGQFLSHDPAGFAAGDPNLYRYCGNSPTNFTDPSGMYESSGSGGQGDGWSGESGNRGSNTGGSYIADTHQSPAARELRRSNGLPNDGSQLYYWKPPSGPWIPLKPGEEPPPNTQWVKAVAVGQKGGVGYYLYQPNAKTHWQPTYPTTPNPDNPSGAKPNWPFSQLPPPPPQPATQPGPRPRAGAGSSNGNPKPHFPSHPLGTATYTINVWGITITLPGLVITIPGNSPKPTPTVTPKR